MDYRYAAFPARHFLGPWDKLSEALLSADYETIAVTADDDGRALGPVPNSKVLLLAHDRGLSAQRETCSPTLAVAKSPIAETSSTLRHTLSEI